MANSFTLKIPGAQQAEVRGFFADHGFEFREHNHAYFQARGPGCNATFYTSGKLLLQGKEAEVYRGLLGEVSNDARPYHAALSRHPQPAPGVWAGTDEAGKGDYFGEGYQSEGADIAHLLQEAAHLLQEAARISLQQMQALGALAYHAL